MTTPTTYVIDIDGTLCDEVGHDVSNRVPYRDRVNKINKLHEAGDRIVIFTSRGMASTGGDPIASDRKYREITEQQLFEWGVQYDALYFGKPRGDVYVDNLNQTIRQFFHECDLTTDSGAY